MNRLHTVPSFKEILTEKRRELLGTSLVVLIILMQVTTQLVNFLKKDEVHGLYTYTYSMNVQGIILLIVPSIGISLLIVKGLYMLKAIFPQQSSTRNQKATLRSSTDRHTPLQKFTGTDVLDEVKYIKSVMKTFDESNNYILQITNHKVFKSKLFNAVIGILFYVVCSTLVSIPPFSYLFAMFDSSILKWVIILTAIFATVKGKDFLNQWLTKKRIAKNEISLKQRGQLRNEAAKYLREQQLVPKHYLHLDAVNKIIGYMSDKRAVTTREAINLYESDEQIRQQQNILREQKRILREMEYESNQQIKQQQNILDEMKSLKQRNH